MVLRGRFRQHWKSWLALSFLVAVAGGLVLSAAAAGRRTAGAFPGYVATTAFAAAVNHRVALLHLFLCAAPQRRRQPARF